MKQNLRNSLLFFPLQISAYFHEEGRLYFLVSFENRNCDVLSGLLLHMKTNISNIVSPKMSQADEPV